MADIPRCYIPQALVIDQCNTELLFVPAVVVVALTHLTRSQSLVLALRWRDRCSLRIAGANAQRTQEVGQRNHQSQWRCLAAPCLIAEVLRLRNVSPAHHKKSHPRMGLLGTEFSAMELNASVLLRLNALDLEACEQHCLSRVACVAMEFYVVGQHTQTGTNCKLIEVGR